MELKLNLLKSIEQWKISKSLSFALLGRDPDLRRKKQNHIFGLDKMSRGVQQTRIIILVLPKDGIWFYQIVKPAHKKKIYTVLA